MALSLLQTTDFTFFQAHHFPIGEPEPLKEALGNVKRVHMKRPREAAQQLVRLARSRFGVGDALNRVVVYSYRVHAGGQNQQQLEGEFFELVELLESAAAKAGEKVPALPLTS